tara:strand:+ start:73 stop:690 length:618 start_codon:yes stop_codon:yes gene_type:complete
MVKVTFAIGVCHEARELDDLLHFLVIEQSVIEYGDEVNVMMDSVNVTKSVRSVLERYPDVRVCEHALDEDFSKHRNYHITQCNGDVIFMLDADEMPQVSLIDIARKNDQGDIIYVPRMNICPGYSQKWLDKHNFKVNNIGFINWPDFQGRIFKNVPHIRWEGKVHEKLNGSDKVMGLPPDVSNGLWHIKNLKKQDHQNLLYDTIV